MRDSIISLYVEFSAAVRRVNETDGESSMKLAPGSMEVKAGHALLSLNRVDQYLASGSA